jgi:hypothetical protein
MSKTKMPKTGMPKTPATQQVRTMKVRIATARPGSYLMRAAITREQPRRIGKLLPTEYALSNVEVRAKRLKEALRDLRGWRNKNAELAVLSPDLPELFAVIKRTLKKLE